MNLEVSFKNVRPRDDIRQRSQALYKKLERFMEPASEGRLVVSVEHSSACLELVVSAHGQVHKVEVEEDELRTAVDKVFHTMEVTLRRQKGKVTDRRQEGARRQDGFVTPDEDEDEDDF
jgi:ribosomal subunit interface protein